MTKYNREFFHQSELIETVCFVLMTLVVFLFQFKHFPWLIQKFIVSIALLCGSVRQTNTKIYEFFSSVCHRATLRHDLSWSLERWYYVRCVLISAFLNPFVINLQLLASHWFCSTALSTFPFASFRPFRRDPINLEILAVVVLNLYLQLFSPRCSNFL